MAAVKVAEAEAVIPREHDNRRLVVAYVVSLAVIAAAIVGTYIFVQSGLREQEQDASTVNVAGRQRMLSQKIAKQLFAAQEGDRSALTEAVADLEADLEGWRSAHDTLRSNGSSTASGPGNSEKVEGLFEEIEPHFQAMSVAASGVLDFVNGNLDAPLSIRDEVASVRSNEGRYLQLMDRIVDAYEQEARARVSRTRLMLTISLVLVLAVLLLEALFIFRPAIRHTKRTADELRVARRRAEELSLLDELTGIPNRRMLARALEQECRRLARESEPLTIIMLDLDHMKILNDLEGHQRGDDCLVDVARVLSRALRRPGDFVARYGGDEFAVVLPKTDAEGARQVVELLKRAVAGLGITMGTPPNVRRLTVSAGAATGHPGEDDFDTGGLFAEADRLLYEDKKASRLPGLLRDDVSILDIDSQGPDELVLDLPQK
jgi:diguanylate cyclase (GGDEF)-like protein